MNIFTASALTATMICAMAGVMILFGFGTPNLSDGSSLTQWWITLWTLSFISLPLGIGCGIVAIKTGSVIYSRVCRS